MHMMSQKRSLRNPEAGIETVTGPVVSPKSAVVDLIRNCDLPPPQKVFAGSDNAVVAPMNRVCCVRDGEREKSGGDGIGGTEPGKLELLKALRLSQTRAREAERKCAQIAKERAGLCNALMAESRRLFAYRQWVRLLEAQVSKMQSQKQQLQVQYGRCCDQWDQKKTSSEEEDYIKDGGGMTWIVALALCLGIAGVGFAFGHLGTDTYCKCM